MKKNLLFAFGLISLLSSCSIIAPTSSSNIDFPSSSIVNTYVDDGTVNEQDKQYPTNINDDFDFTSMTDGDFDTSKWYRNDLDDMQLPDPYVLTVDEDGEEVYYIYGTTDRTGSKTLDCYRTTDFNEFVLTKDIDDQRTTLWSYYDERSKFAPEVYEFDGTYYLYYSANHKDNKRRYISVMTSDNPAGPYTEYYANKPTFDHVANTGITYSVLDQTLLIDDDGSIYMYYSVYDDNASDDGIREQYIVGVELIDPVTADWSTYKILARPGKITPTDTSNKLTWEYNHRTGFNVLEGPIVMKSPDNGLYYMTYSANHYTDRYYTVCYAYSDSPLGTYIKPYTNGGDWTNLFFGYAGPTSGTIHDQWEGFMSGTAHHCIFKSGDQYMIGYHAHKDRANSTSGRMFALDYIFFNYDGTPFTRGPTYSIQPLPEKISGYENIAPYASINSDGIDNTDRLIDDFVVEHYNLSQEQNREVTIPEGKSYLEFVFSQNYIVSGLLIYNSAFYSKAMTEDISFINFQNGNAITNGEFNLDYINDDKSFINPCSTYTFDFVEVETNRIVIEFDTSMETAINEIVILGYVV